MEATLLVKLEAVEKHLEYALRSERECDHLVQQAQDAAYEYMYCILEKNPWQGAMLREMKEEIESATVEDDVVALSTKIRRYTATLRASKRIYESMRTVRQVSLAQAARVLEDSIKQKAPQKYIELLTHDFRNLKLIVDFLIDEEEYIIHCLRKFAD